MMNGALKVLAYAAGVCTIGIYWPGRDARTTVAAEESARDLTPTQITKPSASDLESNNVFKLINSGNVTAGVTGVNLILRSQLGAGKLSRTSGYVNDTKVDVFTHVQSGHTLSVTLSDQILDCSPRSDH